jgi:hypothetical protein
MGAMKIRLLQVHVAEIRSLQVGAPEVHPLQVTRCVIVLVKLSLDQAREPVEERLSAYALRDRVELADPQERDGAIVLEIAPVSRATLRGRLQGLLEGDRGGSVDHGPAPVAARGRR